MSFKIVKPADQSALIEAALLPTESTGFSQDAVAYGLKDDAGSVAAVAVFDGFNDKEAQMHFAILNGSNVTRYMIEAFTLAAFHHHPFCLNLEKVWAHMSASNRSAIRAALAVGFDFEYRKRAGFRGRQDAIVMSMARKEPGKVAARPHEAVTP